jgi:hypothetical protein
MVSIVEVGAVITMEIAPTSRELRGAAKLKGYNISMALDATRPRKRTAHAS